MTETPLNDEMTNEQLIRAFKENQTDMRTARQEDPLGCRVGYYWSEMTSMNSYYADQLEARGFNVYDL